MSFWELRQVIESATPWWSPFAFAAACCVVVIAIDSLKRKYQQQKERDGTR